MRETPLYFQKEPREPIYLYEPAAEGDMYSGPPGGNFQPPPRDGPNNWRYGGRVRNRGWSHTHTHRERVYIYIYI